MPNISDSMSSTGSVALNATIASLMALMSVAPPSLCPVVDFVIGLLKKEHTSIICHPIAHSSQLMVLDNLVDFWEERQVIPTRSNYLIGYIPMASCQENVVYGAHGSLNALNSSLTNLLLEIHIVQNNDPSGVQNKHPRVSSLQLIPHGT